MMTTALEPLSASACELLQSAFSGTDPYALYVLEQQHMRDCGRLLVHIDL
jgi:hypothetical protein